MKLLIKLMLLGCGEYSTRLWAESIKHDPYVKCEKYLNRTYNKQSTDDDMLDIFHGVRMMPKMLSAAKMLDIADRPRSVFGVLSVHAVVCESLPQDAFGNVGLAGLIGKTGVELGAIRRVIKKIKTLPQQNKVNALGSGTGEEENWILSSIAVVSQGAVKSN